MKDLITSLSEKLGELGFATLEDCGPETFEEVARALGREILRTEVRVSSHARAMVVSSEPIAWHQDSPDARWMAWFCVDPGQKNETTDLLSTQRILRKLSAETLAALRDVVVIDRSADGGTRRRPLYDGRSLYYCPWLLEDVRSAASARALAAFEEQVRVSEPVHAQRWRRNQALIIDNHRCLHRRPRLNPRTSRHLTRLWISDRNEG